MESPLMRAPAEIRMMIYEYLFDDGGNEWLVIESAGAGTAPPAKGKRSRSRYYVLDRSLHRRCYETTYRLGTEGARFCAALMRANRAVYGETAHLVYGRHSFDFGGDVEAVEPFLSDLTPPSRRLVRGISLYKRGGPAATPLCDSDCSEWRRACRFLRDAAAAPVRRLRLVVQAGRPAAPWDGPQEFTAAELKLLADIKHESLDWVAELAGVRGIEELEVVADVHYCPPPVSTSMIVFSAFSASIERGLAEFLRSQLRLG
ncbi:hypothetical protein F5X99DRAFT_117489 [Biscogniauxia marginata]|nr:hypothetical protein F5X99DRAFT_117489 [Biscogniauxia marginata]